MKNYDYKDEQKDVKGKVCATLLVKLAHLHFHETLAIYHNFFLLQTERLNAITELQGML